MRLHTAHARQSFCVSHGNTEEGVNVSAGHWLHSSSSRSSVYAPPVHATHAFAPS